MRALAMGLTLMVAVAACGSTQADSEAGSPTPTASPEPGRTAEPSEAVDATPAPTPTPVPEPAPDPAEVGANELGDVPVLMFHGIVDEPADEWQMTPDQLRSQLESLHEQGYYPIRTIDLVRGEIDIPAGRSPVVFTFDDTLPSQFSYTDDGEIDPETAVGILLDFAEANPDFPAVGSFYVTDNLFKDPQRGTDMLADLHELGFEIGNHTVGHANLSELSADEARRQLALGAQLIRDAVPDAEVATLSLPLGRWPADREVAHAGSHDGIDYSHEGVLLVGAHPSPSPFADDFEALAIPRIIAQPGWDGGEPDFMSGFWLDRLNSTDSAYVSDGNPETISFPADLADGLAGAHADVANPYDS